MAHLSCGISRPAATVNPPGREVYRTYTYDAVGNRLTEASNAGATIYAYDIADRLSTVTAPGPLATTYTFDANGNQTTAGAQTFSYDLADRLKTATVGASTETYAYAGDGVRLSASTGAAANQTTKSLWDRNFGLPQLAIERDGNNALLRYYRYGLDLLRETAGSTTYYYHPDGLGLAADVTGSTGTSLTWSESYPYGQVRQAGIAGSGAPAVQPFGFTGEQLDSLTGLYHLRARQYDPGTGRFLTNDPVAGPNTDPYVASYAYVRNNPARHTDPGGTCSPAAVPAAALAGGGVFSLETTGAALACMAALWLITEVIVKPAIEDVINSAKPQYPESQPKYDPRGDPQTERAFRELLRRYTPNELGGPGPGGLMGRCLQYKTLCTALVAGLTVVAGAALSSSGGPEALEERFLEPKPQGK